jgi:uroporphyrinogen decarboxylase
MAIIVGPGRVRAKQTRRLLPVRKVATPAYTSRQRLLDAALCRPTDRPPIWMMRQAGRCLPEYRALKEKYTFLELVRTPDLATEVTLQPVRRFGFDAAILFSDILVIPEAMGQGYHFRETGGVQMEFTLRNARDIERLTMDAIEERLHYVSEALRQLKGELAGRTALIGFSGAPWTLANFMLDGGSSPHHRKGLRLLRENPKLLNALLEKLTGAVTSYLNMQIAAGADVVQIFDTHAGLLPDDLFEAASGQWIRRIIAGLEGDVPVIVFAKGTRDWKTMLGVGANVLGIDPAFDLSEARKLFPKNVAIQGNLSPELLLDLSPNELEVKTTQLLEKMRGRPGYIFNLGHGVPPTTPLENIARVVSTVQKFRDNPTA